MIPGVFAAGAVRGGEPAPGGDPHWANVVSLQNFMTDMTDATGRVWTPENGVVVSGGALQLDGSAGKSIITESLSATNDFRWWTQPFTLEAYIRTNVTGGDTFGRGYAVIEGVYEPGTMNWWLGLNRDRRAVFGYWGVGGRNSVTGTTVYTLGVEHHFEMSFDGTTIRLFVDGLLEASSALGATPAPTTTVPVRIGASGVLSTGARFEGAVRGFRATLGVARHVSSFTPPALPLPNFGP